jgi:hypothetical protein
MPVNTARPFVILWRRTRCRIHWQSASFRWLGAPAHPPPPRQRRSPPLTSVQLRRDVGRRTVQIRAAPGRSTSTKRWHVLGRSVAGAAAAVDAVIDSSTAPRTRTHAHTRTFSLSRALVIASTCVRRIRVQRKLFSLKISVDFNFCHDVVHRPQICFVFSLAVVPLSLFLVFRRFLIVNESNASSYKSRTRRRGQPVDRPPMAIGLDAPVGVPAAAAAAAGHGR